MDIKIQYLADATQHIPRIAQGIFEEWSKYDPTLEVNSISQKLHSRLNKNQIPTILVATNKEQLCGVVGLKEKIRIPGYENRKLWLGGLIVFPDYRNIGIGSLLVNEALKIARNLGFETISLFTTVPDARSWYIHKGWHEFAQDTFYGNPAWLFEKTLI